jgi:flagellar basal-body rod protein FlgB
MQTGSIPLFTLLTSRMSWLSTRQAVLSENVANADTPGYGARDVKPMDFEMLLSGQGTQGMTVTNTRHIGAPLRGPGVPEPVEIAGTNGSSTGNTVSLEQEMIKLSDTQIQYQTATNIYQKAINMFRTALGGRS